MQLTLTNTGKRFNREWIFRHFNHEFLPGGKYAVTGPNGSGKSTLLQVIAGSLTHNEGSVVMVSGNQQVMEEDRHKHLSMAAPYLELVEEMTGSEFLSFHQLFKPFVTPINEMLMQVGLARATNKQIRYYSSGMKQRLKLAQAFFCGEPLLLLDEPTTNLDAEGIRLYHELIEGYTKNKLLIISSNDRQEYEFCEEVIRIGEYKQQT